MSSIPIVQGTAVPVGGEGGAAGKNSYQSQQNEYGFGDNDVYVAAPSENQPFNNNNNRVGREEQQQPSQFRDPIWAVAFILHLIAMVGVISYNLAAGAGGGGDAASSSSIGGLLFLTGVCGLAAVGIGTLTLNLMMKFPKEMVKASLIFTVGMSLFVAVIGFMSGQVFFGCLGLFSFAIGVCYAKLVWPRIPFAAANMNTALTAVKSNMGLSAVAYGIMALALGWTTLWFVGLGGALATSNTGILFLLLLSYYWTHQVLANTVHVTTAGTVGTWWFVPEEANSCWSSAIQDSFCRATTYSFGSICFGSFLVALVQALRALANMARQNDDMQLLLCIVECILACIQSIIEYFNQWAYVYVGLYGQSFLEAGQNVMQLFQQKGWTVIINDDLVDRVLLMVSVGVGFLVGFIGMIIALTNNNLLAGIVDNADGTSVGAVGFFVGMVAGFVFTSILMSVVGSANNTVIVCFAESPAEFEANHPQLSAEMRSAWVQAWPELQF
mmetsp:Transcript_22250/g.52364  ORF Transcript_22250/g.52364 Transcript_22250/m.52364 type:complete len:498 (+) Transcript_22250:81-1574(+)